MMNNVQGLFNLAVSWGVAALVGVFSMAMLMILGDWTLIQAIYVGLIVIVALGAVLAITMCGPLPTRRVADDVAAAPKPAPKPEPTPEPAPQPAPAVETRAAD